MAHDGHFFCSLVFTKEAWKTIREEVKEESLDLCDMVHHRLAITKLQIQLRKVESTNKIFTSYATLEIRLIAHKASVVPRSGEQKDGARRPYVHSMFRDNEMRTLLLSCFHRSMKQFDIPDFP